MKKIYSLISCAALMFLSGTGFLTMHTVPANAAEVSSDFSALKGKVLETMDSGGYTYLQIETANGPTWAAIPQTQIEKGQEVTVNPGAVMNNFPSKTLNRTFDSIIFSSGIANGKPTTTTAVKTIAQPATGDNSFAQALQAEASGANPHAFSNSSAGALSTSGSSNAVAPAIDLKVEKVTGENGFTVGELFAKSKELNDKNIQIRGKVVKVSKMIMGKNWLHIQDGTGDSANNTHDLVVTTMAEPAKDSVVIIEGVLHTDKDFGYGYKYAVIVEDAVIK